LPFPSKVHIKVFDILGREVLPMITKDLTEGFNRIQLNFGNMATGVYIYNIEANGQSASGKLLLLK
jgi:hypothetical protein